MTNEIYSARVLLEGSGISLLDAARLIRNALDARPPDSAVPPVQFCSKIIEAGKRHVRSAEMSVAGGFALYLESKRHLRPESLRDIRYLGKRILASDPSLAKRRFSEFNPALCEQWLRAAFGTPSQFNKARSMLHGLFQFALRRGWCDKNSVSLVEKRKIIEKEIKPLSLRQVKKLLRTSRLPKFRDCSAGVGLLLLAGIRPREVRRLEWRDIDIEESAITIRSRCSKTGGARQVEICPALKSWLLESVVRASFPCAKSRNREKICPKNFSRKWKAIRDRSGFAGRWVQDSPRHTYASYHAKRYRDLPRLQLNMGHRDISLLRSRYVNMCGISAGSARNFFN
ncbi:MAG: tyrosine-type recombinase/integrase [Opitutales bacterium]|nr:tyrosine-type recombinase/integrase [Opitutales bacterium]